MFLFFTQSGYFCGDAYKNLHLTSNTFFWWNRLDVLISKSFAFMQIHI